MKGSKISRRDVLVGASALTAGAAFSTRVLSAAPPASPVTPAMIEGAKKEGKVVWYTSVRVSPARSSVPAPNASCSASGRNTPQTFMQSTS